MMHLVKRLFLSACLPTTLLVSPARADAVADISKATCAQMASLAKGDRQQLLVWLSGYYAGAAQRSIIDREKMEASIKALQTACEKEPKTPLIGDQARAIMLGEPLDAGNNPLPVSGTQTGGQVVQVPAASGPSTPSTPKTMTVTPSAGATAKPQVR